MFVDNVGNSAACVPFLTTVLGSRHHVSHLAWAVDAILWLQASRPVGKPQTWGCAGVGAASLNHCFRVPAPPGVPGASGGQTAQPAAA